MKKVFSILCTMVFLLATVAATTACSAKTTDVPSTGKDSSPVYEDIEIADVPSENGNPAMEFVQPMIIGQVQSVDGNTVTLLLGEQSRPEQAGAPEGTDGQTPPEMPDFDAGQMPPEMPTGDAPFGNGETPPERPDDASDTFPSGRGGFGGFVSGTETAEYDLTNAQILIAGRDQTTDGSMDDIAEGTILQLVVENDTVTTVTVRIARNMDDMNFDGTQPPMAETDESDITG